MKTKNFGLDLIRATAILLVVVYHSVNLLQLFIDNFFIVGKIAACTQVFGLLGVEIFFVLSGFLIGGIIIDYFTINPVNIIGLYSFWGRRWFRTLPQYYIILVVLFYLNYHQIDSNTHITHFILFFQNFFSPHPIFFAEAWSLSIEEWFYFLFPILLLLSRLIIYSKKNSQMEVRIILNVALCYVIIAFICKFLYIFLFNNAIINFDTQIRKVVIMRLDAPMYGVLLAYCFKTKNVIYSKINKYKHHFFIFGILGILISLLVIYISDHPSYVHFFDKEVFYIFRNILYFPILAVFIAITFPFIICIQPKSKIIKKSINFISSISYPMYLIHYSLVYLLIFKDLNLETYFMSLKAFLLYWFIIITLSLALHLIIEKPILRFRDKVLPR
ncbi:MAG: acyltransferase [Saprospiraceae bacterium]|nr:acyltransferase [Saprospiraceae bacterium]